MPKQTFFKLEMRRLAYSPLGFAVSPLANTNENTITDRRSAEQRRPLVNVAEVTPR